MSFNRENVIWQSPDGTWNRGFYTANTHDAYDDEDYDPEWDVDYEWSSFQWVSTGHPSQEAAHDAWRGSNPGGHNVVYDTLEISGLDDMAAKAQTDGAIYHGPAKRRLIQYIAKDLTNAQIEAHSYKLGGYANLPNRRIAEWTKELDARMRTASDVERKQVRTVMRDAGRRLTEMADATKLHRYNWQGPDRAPAVEAARKQADTFTRYRGPQKAPASQGSGAARAKTTGKSTAGSYAPRGFGAPEITL
ncbi:hypothetical protein [Leifsonia sp. Leaf264]|uniref:hypothetical protein n=1 Tax=Leifsonia sp. Leaf264 TaxID=1736314 RepID=UPI0006F62D10|nr:hypothetical protein [Leifsonia sp. Leaf264]KQO98820.1 hypothetical protein ASF30_12215 [Leifsonia sp. Leaf264]